MKKKYGALVLIFAGVIILLYVGYKNISDITRPFSAYNTLSASWENYKTRFILEEGRVVDYAQNEITTSEGQSYAMLRSVIIDDKETFDKVWNWTKNNLKRPGDNLFGWRWGKNENNSYGFTGQGGDNSASDADTDIALALILAGRRWGDKTYIDESKKILNNIWFMETAEVRGKRYLIAGNWAKDDIKIVINPSYLAPYAYRIFQEIDKDHDWTKLIDSSYEILEKASNEKLDKLSTNRLPPDWIQMEVKTGEIKAVSENVNLTTNYSYDALRVPIRIAIDNKLNKEPRAKSYLENSFTQLINDYKSKKRIATIYAHDGTVIDTKESPSQYASFVTLLTVIDNNLAKEVYEEKIIKLYSTSENTFSPSLPYYDQNLLWFAGVFYNTKI